MLITRKDNQQLAIKLAAIKDLKASAKKRHDNDAWAKMLGAGSAEDFYTQAAVSAARQLQEGKIQYLALAVVEGKLAIEAGLAALTAAQQTVTASSDVGGKLAELRASFLACYEAAQTASEKCSNGLRKVPGIAEKCGEFLRCAADAASQIINSENDQETEMRLVSVLTKCAEGALREIEVGRVELQAVTNAVADVERKLKVATQNVIEGQGMAGQECQKAQERAETARQQKMVLEAQLTALEKDQACAEQSKRDADMQLQRELRLALQAFEQDSRAVTSARNHVIESSQERRREYSATVDKARSENRTRTWSLFGLHIWSSTAPPDSAVIEAAEKGKELEAEFCRERDIAYNDTVAKIRVQHKEARDRAQEETARLKKGIEYKRLALLRCQQQQSTKVISAVQDLAVCDWAVDNIKMCSNMLVIVKASVDSMNQLCRNSESWFQSLQEPVVRIGKCAEELTDFGMMFNATERMKDAMHHTISIALVSRVGNICLDRADNEAFHECQAVTQQDAKMRAQQFSELMSNVNEKRRILVDLQSQHGCLPLDNVGSRLLQDALDKQRVVGDSSRIMQVVPKMLAAPPPPADADDHPVASSSASDSATPYDE